MYRIKTENLELLLEIVAIGSLSLHEKILTDVANKLVLEFKNFSILRNPIIVDQNNIVLDGTHRAYAFDKLGFNYIPVCKLDYLNETAKLRYWFRFLGNVGSLNMLKSIVEELGGRFQEVNNSEALKKALECNQFSCGIQNDNYFAAFGFPDYMVYDAVAAYDLLEEIQGLLIKQGVEVKYIPCDSVNEKEFCDSISPNEMVIWTPHITKEMVIDAVKKQKVFAPKSTRHLIPARPIKINVPTYWFKENIPLDEINERFSRFLRKKSIRRFGPGQVIDGRYYEEELFVFFDKKD